jgi:hypothetical protein
MNIKVKEWNIKTIEAVTAVVRLLHLLTLIFINAGKA